jgi:hypothetical protein
MAGARFAETLSTPPDAKTPILERRNQDSEKPMGEWNSVDINCNSGVIECKVNGILQNSVTSCEPQSGKIGLQLEGTPYQVRHMWLTILD